MLKKVQPVPLAEVAAYLAPFARYFKRSEGRESLERHVTGLLAELDCKNGEQIARAVAGTNTQRLQATTGRAAAHFHPGFLPRLLAESLPRGVRGRRHPGSSGGQRLGRKFRRGPTALGPRGNISAGPLLAQ